MSDAFELEICQGKYRYRYEAGKQEVWRNGYIWQTLNGKLIGDKFVFSLAVELDEALKECGELRAKIEAMEQQEPVATIHINSITGNPSVYFIPGHRYLHHNSSLYALPGAQPAPSEQDASVRKAWARFSHELHRSPDAPYPGMADAFEQHFSQSFIDREWRAEATTWAAAWKAAKRHGAQLAPSVPEGWKLVPIEVVGLYNFMCAAFVPMTPQQEQIAVQLELAKRAMLAAAPEAKQ